MTGSDIFSLPYSFRLQGIYGGRAPGWRRPREKPPTLRKDGGTPCVKYVQIYERGS